MLRYTYTVYHVCYTNMFCNDDLHWVEWGWGHTEFLEKDTPLCNLPDEGRQWRTNVAQ